MIEVKPVKDGFTAVFMRSDYSRISGVGDTHEQALKHLKCEIEALMKHDELMIARAAEALEDIKGMMGGSWS